MVNRSRHDFSEATKRTVAMRVNSRCSNPTCGAATSGPQSDPTKASNVGVAAHITAAAKGGPRFDSNLSEDERKATTNAIWLCQTCAKLVDDDPPRFTVALLRHWRETAERLASENIGKPALFGRSGAPEFLVVKQEAVPAAPGSRYIELPSMELVTQLSSLLDLTTSITPELLLLDRGYGAMGQPYAITGVGSNYGWDWEVVFFSAGELGWEIVARTTVTGQKGNPPSVTYIPGLPGALALTHLAGTGTGMLRRITTWHRIASGSPMPFLSYPVKFWVVGWGLPFDRQLTSRLLKLPSVLQTGAELQIEFDTEYSMPKHLAPSATDSRLFSIREQLTMEWNEEAGMFIPHSSEDDFARIDDLWNEGTKGFVARYSNLLSSLAKEGNYDQKEFIQRHLLQ